MIDAQKPKITITKSRAGHYSVTARVGNFKHTINKLASAQHARNAATDAVAIAASKAEKAQ